MPEVREAVERDGEDTERLEHPAQMIFSGCSGFGMREGSSTRLRKSAG
jgi:hypothetical protein